MEAFISLLVFAVFFYVMMRFGCGAHVIHGDHSDHDKRDEKRNRENPVDRMADNGTGRDVSLRSGTNRDDTKSHTTLNDASHSDLHH